MDNTDITIDDFANKLMLSRTVFYRKLKSIVGPTPVDFVCEMRIKRAAQLIEKSEYSFFQIAYIIGFNDPKYFSRRLSICRNHSRAVSSCRSRRSRWM